MTFSLSSTSHHGFILHEIVKQKVIELVTRAVLSLDSQPQGTLMATLRCGTLRTTEVSGMSRDTPPLSTPLMGWGAGPWATGKKLFYNRFDVELRS